MNRKISVVFFVVKQPPKIVYPCKIIPAMQDHTLDEEVVEDKDFYIETDMDDISTHIYSNVLKPKQTSHKVEIVLPTSRDSLFQTPAGFLEAIGILEKENKRMERNISRLMKKEAKIEKDNEALREMLSEMLTKLP